PDGDPLKIVKVGDAKDADGNVVGTVTNNGEGTVTFDPPPGFFGPVTIDYAVSDGQGGTDVATITVNVEKDTDGDGIADIRDFDDDNDGILDTVENQKGDIDTDGDGIINSLDLDSDNDGISDLVESGANADLLDADGNGTIDGKIAQDGDKDGLADIVEKINGPDTGTKPVDSDKDGFDDYKDLDSDNDGISDFIEAQPTADFETYSPKDSDGDGVIDLADTGSGFGGAFDTPTNTDDDKLADYLDGNSDNDGQGNDIDESGLALSGSSTNGIDDGAGVTFDDQDGAVSGDGLAGLSVVLSNDDSNPNELDFRAFPCFAAGSMIVTSTGSVAVEDLEVGDKVLTLDNGFQPIRWVGKRTVDGMGKMAPIRFAKNTLGAEQDLFVSPQHRMLVTGWQAELIAGMAEVLVPAKHLINDGSVRQIAQDHVTYVHILFDQHEVIWANGVASESFHPARMGLGTLEEDTREELYALFPELRLRPQSAYGPSARLTLRAHEAALMSLTA
ncbi:MAG: Hint domain-containing protein, partial [Pseudomonadota bacterium]